MTRIVTLAGYSLLAVLVVGWSAYTHPRPAWWTLPQLVARFARSRAGRVVIVLVWAWLGWHLFARGSGAFE
jgi:sirohydrochlorin ferrochelatase